MNSMRKILCFLTAMALATFALPGFAASSSPTKMFSVTLSAAAPVAGKQVVTATFYNQTPSGGNSTINSVILYAPNSPNLLKIISATTPQGGTPTIAADGSAVSVINMPGIKAGQTPPASWTMTVTLDTSGAPACTSTSYTWPTPSASTGNTPTASGGVPFAFQASLSTNPFATSVSSHCTYSLVMSPTSVSVGTSSQAMTATFTNPSSNGQSFGSLSLTAPSGFTIASATPPSGTATIAGDARAVNVSGISVAPGGTYALTLSVNVVCGAGAGTWDSAVWSGSPVGIGTAFGFNAGSSSIQTSVTGSCALKFLTQPSNGLVNTAISPAIVVGLVDPSNNVVRTFTDNVTLSKKSGPGTLSGVGPIAAISGAATFNSLAANAIGDYVLTATSGSLTVDSNPFTVYGGQLYCNPTPPFTFSDPNGTVTDPLQSGYAAGERGYWNKDGLNCTTILYTFTNTILTNNTVHLAWDTTTSQHPAFTYSMTWKAEDVDNVLNPASIGPANYGWPVPRRPYFYWLPTDGSVTTIPTGSHAGLACAGPDLPAPYGMLDADLNTTTTSVTVDVPPIVPSSAYPTASLLTTAVPFPIAIGTERIKVTNVAPGPGASQFTLTVTRGDGGTPIAGHLAVNAANATIYNQTGKTYVMSTPLPLDPTLTPDPIRGIVAPMCVVNQGWMAAGTNPATGVPQVRYFTTVYDIGDGWVTFK